MNMTRTFGCCAVLFTLCLSTLQGCSNTNSRINALHLQPGQDIVVNYALDVQTRKYSTGKFVSMDDQWITILKTEPIDAFDRRKWHASFNLDRVYLIQAAQGEATDRQPEQ